jgi:predicted acetyltransferase
MDYGQTNCDRDGDGSGAYGTFMLRAMLDKAKEMGLGRVLVTCDARNIASTGVIAKCGGAMESESHFQGAGRITRKYWIDLQDVRPAEPCQ